MPAKISLIGQTFGKLKVIADAPMRRTSGGTAKHYYLCQCECGNQKEVRANSLSNGDTKSCGCLQKITKSNLSHGHASDHGRSKEYIAWDHMIQRCTNPNCKMWEHYGGRGILVDESWMRFANFLADMGPRPERMTLERKDNSKGYNKDNCVWDTQRNQSRNKRTNRNFTINGVTGCMTDLAKHFGIAYKTVQGRIDISKWEPVRAFTEPVSKRTWKNKPGRPNKESSEPTENITD